MADPEDDLKELPSRIIYNKFKGTSCNSQYKQYQIGIRNMLKEHSDIKKHEDQIVEAWCHVTRMWDTSVLWDTNILWDERCKFLYFWVGNLIQNDSESGKFSARMGKIYEALNYVTWKNKCDIAYPDVINKNLFSKRKIVFDYSHDRVHVQKELEKSGSPNKHLWCAYALGIAAAYKEVQEDCDYGDNKSKGYCTKFKGTYIKYNPEQLLSSHCEIVLAEQLRVTTEVEKPSKQGDRGEVELRKELQEEEERREIDGLQIEAMPEAELDENQELLAHQALPDSSSTTTTGLFSILSIAGLGSITFLLYKVSLTAR
ncbi:hypothetical protein PCYB_007230 [Plasmodium cynomolgi strain B]|uniref:CYIR protein n=1 Tax=Plasmodium cynomolgi (strain B) TaxID=1120755 RepID=K6V0V7_PLACD|nr:hypothetical protein PCYB_007230 [Plasmodium cynomolgi strain B]GAB69974.1 hypothetical protein PCYB_007230 [Plasmodium cynomolgi strain B]